MIESLVSCAETLTRSFGPVDEAARLIALQRLEILDTGREPEFDDILEIAAVMCGATQGAISLIDSHRQWFKASLGLPMTETPRSQAFCHHTIQQTDLMLVEDATKDSRFVDNPLVTAEGGVRFYAGFPVTAPNGQPVGALCLLDSKPRTLTNDQKAVMRVLAGQVTTRLELRTQRRELEAALAEAEAVRAHLSNSERQFQCFMDSGPFMSFMKDGEGRMLYYNARVAERFKISRDEWLGKSDAELWPLAVAETFRMNDQQAMASDETVVTLEEVQNPDGSVSVMRSFKFPCRNVHNHTVLGGISLDVTAELEREAALRSTQRELELANERLSRLALIDALTGLANRRVFDEQFKVAFREARMTGRPLTLLMMDVDNFKRHNDKYGHPHGDEVLRQLAHCLEQQVRAGDLAARYGGEEFAILMPDADTDSGLRLAERLLDQVRALEIGGVRMTISIGLASLEDYTRDTVHLLTQADEALYLAKQTGKDRVTAHMRLRSRDGSTGIGAHGSAIPFPKNN